MENIKKKVCKMKKVRKNNDGSGDPTTRDNILALIEQNPGSSFSQLCRLAGKTQGIIQYHAHVLERNKMITSTKDGQFKRYYARKSRFDEMAKNILASWQRPTERIILTALSKEKIESIGSLARLCTVTRAAITWHVTRMKENGIVVNNDRSLLLSPAAMEKITMMMNDHIIIAE